jgi:hypothetical protein
MRVLSTWLVLPLALGLGSTAACGGSTAVNFFGENVGSTGGNASTDGAGAAGSLAGGGQAPSIAGGGSGGSSVGGSSVASAGAATSGASGSTNSGPSDAPCSPVVDGMGGMTGPFGTTGPYCLRVSGDIIGWGCSNFQGRTLKVNGTTVTCSELPLPDKLNGDYYFDVSAGDVTYASMFWY